MTAAVLILLWVQNETSFDNYKDKKSIYRLTTRIPATGWVWETTPLLLAAAIKNEIPEIEKTTRLYTGNQPVFKIIKPATTTPDPYDPSSVYVLETAFPSASTVDTSAIGRGTMIPVINL